MPTTKQKPAPTAHQDDSMTLEEAVELCEDLCENEGGSRHAAALRVVLDHVERVG